MNQAPKVLISGQASWYTYIVRWEEGTNDPLPSAFFPLPPRYRGSKTTCRKMQTKTREKTREKNKEVNKLRLNNNDHVISKANALMRQYGTRDPQTLAEDLGITIMERDFTTLKGVYTSLLRSDFIFLKDNLSDAMKNIVILHEIGHAQLHRDQANCFKEFNLFDMSANVMEYEANLFASQILLPDDEIIDYIHMGYDASMIACVMNSDINLVALKVSELSRRGYAFNTIEHQSNFLKNLQDAPVYPVG